MQMNSGPRQQQASSTARLLRLAFSSHVLVIGVLLMVAVSAEQVKMCCWMKLVMLCEMLLVLILGRVCHLKKDWSLDVGTTNKTEQQARTDAAMVIRQGKIEMQLVMTMASGATSTTKHLLTQLVLLLVVTD
jgi:hypothetical protein